MAPNNTSMDVDIDEGWLDKAASGAPRELHSFYDRFKTLHEKKLWYQLTQAVEEYMANPASAKGTLRLDLYQNFVNTFSSRVNRIRLVALAVIASKQFKEPSEAAAFLQGIAEQTDDEDSQEAFVYATVEAAHYQLVLGDLTKTKESIDKCSKILDSFNTVERNVHASFYRVSGDYHKTRAEYASYYKNSLLYLACIDVETDLTAEERVQRARDLALSALLGDTIYNFGELLLHPILTSLQQSSQHSWLSTMLFAFNSGDIGKFESLLPHLQSEQILHTNQAFLRQKICSMALIESVFRRASTDRTLAFETIAQETRLPLDEVEHLVMKALSLKLIRGSIDQYAQLAKITWVQPRVLDKRQLDALQSRLNAWVGRVEEVAHFVKGQTPELFITA